MADCPGGIFCAYGRSVAIPLNAPSQGKPRSPHGLPPAGQRPTGRAALARSASLCAQCVRRSGFLSAHSLGVPLCEVGRRKVVYVCAPNRACFKRSLAGGAVYVRPAKVRTRPARSENVRKAESSLPCGRPRGAQQGSERTVTAWESAGEGWCKCADDQERSTERN